MRRNAAIKVLAVACLAGISKLGRTPFASKVIAFMCPETCGVYDTQIYKGLTSIQVPTSVQYCVGPDSVVREKVKNKHTGEL